MTDDLTKRTERQLVREDHEELYAFVEEFLKRVPKCTCADYYLPYYPRTDPQCELHGHFDFDDEEIKKIKQLIARRVKDD